MKLTSIITLNEGAYTKLAEWEAAAKKLGYTVTKDNKTGTYHAWDKTSHKGRFNAPTGKGSLTEAAAPHKPRKGSVAWEREQQRKKQARDPEEIKRIEKIGNNDHYIGTAKVTHEGILNKIADKVMGKAPTNKYKVGDDVSYEMDPPQEGGRGKGKITSVSKAGDHYTVNGKLVNHFEIKKKHNNESVNENQVAYICKFSKNGKLYSLWSKGNYWYELTASSQDNSGSFTHIAEWHNKSLDEIKATLQQKGFTEQGNHIQKESAGEPSVDDILYYLTSGYRTLQKYADSYQDFSVITRIYDGLRMDLKEGNYAAFSRSYEEYLSKYPDAASELYDAMFEAAGLPPDEGTIEEFLQKCSDVTESMMEGARSLNGVNGRIAEGDRVKTPMGPGVVVAVLSLSQKVGVLLDSGEDKDFFPEDVMVLQGVSESAKREDMTGCKCTKCKKGTYQETSQMDDTDGVLHCTNCGMKVQRWQESVAEGLSDTQKKIEDTILKLEQRLKFAKTPEQWDNIQNRIERLQAGLSRSKQGVAEAYTGHFNDDDWYEVDPKTNTVLRHAGSHADYRTSATGQPIKLPNGNVLMRGMRAKDLRGVDEGVGSKIAAGVLASAMAAGGATTLTKPAGPAGRKESADPQDAKSKRTVTESRSITEARAPFRVGNVVEIIAAGKYKGELCKVLKIDTPYQLAAVTMINYPDSYFNADWSNFQKVDPRTVAPADPRTLQPKWLVTYDTYGPNKDVPLARGVTKTVYADTAEDACVELKKLVGGRNHKAERISKPV